MIDDKDIPEEDLKGDIVPDIDPAKLFDEKEYSTMIIGSDAAGKKTEENADLATILVNPNTSREEKDEALIRLKQNNATSFLIDAIKRTKEPEYKAILLAACWETGLDFSKDYLFFIEQLLDKDFHVTFEAFTVIQEIESEIPKDQLEQALEILKKGDSSNPYIADSIELINNHLKHND